MAITRRQLFKFLGAAVLATPFLAVSPALAEVENLYVVSQATTKPLTQGEAPTPRVLTRDIKPVYLGSETLVPSIITHAPGKPVFFDPLGQWGFVAWKIMLPNGEQYGNWIKISEIDREEHTVAAIEYGVRFLDYEMKKVIEKLAPNVTVSSPAVNIQIQPGYTEKVVYL